MITLLALVMFLAPGKVTLFAIFKLKIKIKKKEPILMFFLHVFLCSVSAEDKAAV